MWSKDGAPPGLTPVRNGSFTMAPRPEQNCVGFRLSSRTSS